MKFFLFQRLFTIYTKFPEVFRFYFGKFRNGTNVFHLPRTGMYPTRAQGLSAFPTSSSTVLYYQRDPPLQRTVVQFSRVHLSLWPFRLRTNVYCRAMLRSKGARRRPPTDRDFFPAAQVLANTQFRPMRDR